MNSIPTMKEHYDVVIIGAGIVGSMLARELSRYSLDIAVLEKGSDVGEGPSAANSAILHAGNDPHPGTLKARLNKRGNELWFGGLAGDLGVPVKRSGAYVVAIGEDEKAKLPALLANSDRNGIPGAVIRSREEILAAEPVLNPEVTGALEVPTAGIVDPFAGVLASAELAAMNGARFFFDTEVIGIEEGPITVLRTNRGTVKADWVVNAAGLGSDDIMHLAGDRLDASITPRRGEYFVLERKGIDVHHVLFPMPSDKGKGILVSPTCHGNLLLGPNSQYVDSKHAVNTTTPGMDEVATGCKRLVPSLSLQDVIATFVGLRATMGHDFLIEMSAARERFVHLCGIDSPGYVSAPAIAEYVRDLMAEHGLVLRRKPDWIPVRIPPPSIKTMSHEEREALIRKEPSYGRIVCRCELVSEGEVIQALKSVIPARTYDGIKRRCWLGTGRCQGSFDIPKVIEIMSRELGIPMTEINKNGRGSEFLTRATKEKERS